MSNLKDKLSTLTPEQLLALQARVKKAKSSASANGSPIKALPRDREAYPVSFTQKRMWLLQRMEPDNASYNNASIIRLTGNLDPLMLQKSLQKIVDRHEAIRTTFIEQGEGELLQRVHDTMELPLPLIDLEHLPLAEREVEAKRLMCLEAHRPLDLEQGPLLRTSLYRISEAEHLLMFMVHHIVVDGWSGGLFLLELGRLYGEASTGTPANLPALALHYIDFAAWQTEWFSGDVARQQLDYWKEQLSGKVPTLELPTDRTRPLIQRYRGSLTRLQIKSDLVERLQQLSREAETTLFMTLMAAFQALLHRYTGQTDFAVGFPVSGRSREETHGIFGPLVNSLPLRALVSGEESFRELLQRVRERVTGAMTNPDVPLEKLVEELQPERLPGVSPFYQVMFNLNREIPETHLPQLSIAYEMFDAGVAKFDLVIEAHTKPDGLHLVFEYNSDLFDESTMVRFANAYETLLTGVVEQPDSPVWKLPVLSAEDRLRLLVEWNDTATAEDPRQYNVVQAFEKQAILHADEVAVVGGDVRLTYQELNERANRLARFLREQGVDTDTRVGLLVDRTPEMVVAVLGVLKAGGAYVPIDPAYPVERISYMVEDSGVKLLLTQSDLAERLPAQAPRFLLDTEFDRLTDFPKQNLEYRIGADDLVYVIYTSGSTGRPKGVLITHGGLMNYLTWAMETYAQQGHGAPVHSSLAFDLTVTSMYVPLLSGKRVVLVAESMGVDALVEAMRTAPGYSLTKITPAHLQLLGMETQAGDAHTWNHVFVIGGEALTYENIAPWQQHAPDTVLVNEYGPTETVVGCCVYSVPRGEKATGPVPIGRPIANTKLYVLDSHLQPVPIGAVGELYIGGYGVARGYLNRPDLTAERFVENPFEPNTRMYKTGDLARYLADGNLVYLGRLDDQVKIRGYRIELGEIEAVLETQEQIKLAAVIVQDDGQGDKSLLGYYTTVDGTPIKTRDLRSFLKETLPPHMIPTHLVHLESMPLTVNGKIDRRALPAPERAQAEETAPSAALTQLEKQVQAVWEAVLKRETVGVHDNFYEIGGHSVNAILITSRLKKALHVDFQIRDIFQAPTVSKLAAFLGTKLREAHGDTLPTMSPVPRTLPLPLSYEQQRLWLADQLQRDTQYNVRYFWEIEGQLHADALEQSFVEIIRRHEALRTVFRLDGSQPVQVILPDVAFQIERFDLRTTSADQQEATLRQHLDAINTPFDLAVGPMLRAELFQLSEQRHVLHLCVHHIIGDGWSLDILARELTALYEAYTGGEASPLPTLGMNYADYAVWQRRLLEEGYLEGQVQYWKTQLAGVAPLLDLRPDFPRQEVQSVKGSNLRLDLPAGLPEDLEAFSRQEQATLFMTLLAAYNLVLGERSGCDDILVGIPIANRHHEETQSMFGMFLNTLAVRTRLAGAATFRDLLARVRDAAYGAFSNQDVPFDRVIEEVNPERNTAYSPLVQVWFNHQNTPRTEMNLPGLTLRAQPVAEDTVKFDIMLEALTESDGRLSVSLSYNTDLYRAGTAELLASQWQAVLTTIVRRPEVTLAELRVELAELARRTEEQFKQSFQSTRRSKLQATKAKKLGGSPE
ncbi:non-ribosomal peptide synthetase [Tumebacillus permanentifrigoris]|uniref:Amino acid adenylation domain-containing protein n=1 Tax=Tumebacillus permanentifrigoris TaxID=378543 RepID=A0A316D7L8_9BACL|nr:non-ribosomal peptide synthetase [Tumebacillus permanentifrigoris]PWK11299.1 amino acid adenylation domain-containing protein [Tumebacillus permanentifrigoris]